MECGEIEVNEVEEIPQCNEDEKLSWDGSQYSCIVDQIADNVSILDTNTYLSVLNFSTSNGVLSGGLNSGVSVSVDLDGRYLTQEGDPIFDNSEASNITAGDISNWSAAHNWGDHSAEGYLTSYTESDPVYSAWDKSTGISITESQISDLGSYITDGNTGWDNSYGFITSPDDADADASNEIQGIISSQGLRIDASNNFGLINSCSSGQMLKWNGSGWVCQDDIDTTIPDTDTTYAAGSGIGLSGTTFSVSAGTGLIQEADGLSFDTTWGDGRYLGSYTETDPVYSAWDKSTGISITESQISDLGSYITDGNTGWDNSYGFITASSTETLTNKSGNISMWTDDVGYLTSYTETDPVYSGDPASGITGTNITNWDTAYGWGDHSAEGYLTSYTETDPVYSAWDKSTGVSITESQISDLGSYITDGNTGWDNSYGFITASSTETLTNKSGNISMWTNDVGYLTGYTETDPVYSGDPASGITGTNITNWNTAYGWGDHSAEGYLTSYTNNYVDSASFSGTDTKTLTLTRSGLTDLTASFTDRYEADTNTTYSAGSGIGLSGTTFSVSAGTGLIQEAGGLSFDTTWGDGRYLASYTETDPVYSAWDKSTGISITK
jgi:hypothetical protein